MTTFASMNFSEKTEELISAYFAVLTLVRAVLGP